MTIYHPSHPGLSATLLVTGEPANAIQFTPRAG